MTDDQGESLGEIVRSMRRLEASFLLHQTESRARFHELSNTINASLAPISVHTIQIDSQQHAIERLDAEVKAVSSSSARWSGGIAVLVGGGTILVNWLMGRHG